MPNINGEPNTQTEADARKMNWYSPAPPMIIKYSTADHKWKGGPRCQAIKDNGQQCHNYALDKQAKRCKACGGNTQGYKFQQTLNAIEQERQERISPYLNYPDPNVRAIVAQYATDSGRKTLEDEILTAKVAIAMAVKEMQTGDDAKGFRDAGTTKMLLSMMLDLAKLEESKVKIETSEQYVFNPSSVKLLIARLQNLLNRSVEKAAEAHTSQEALDALTDVYKYFREGLSGWQAGGANNQAPLLVEDADEDTLEGEYREG